MLHQVILEGILISAHALGRMATCSCRASLIRSLSGYDFLEHHALAVLGSDTIYRFNGGHGHYNKHLLEDSSPCDGYSVSQLSRVILAAQDEAI